MAENALTVVRKYGENPVLQKRLNDVLDKGAPSFIASVINACANSDRLQKCLPDTIWGAAMTAAAMKLPVDPNLGYAYIVPYGKEAQFQIGYKGLIQLAIRTGQYKRIHTSEVFSDELEFYNPVTGEIRFVEKPDFKERYSSKSTPCGYYATFVLHTGFEASCYMSHEEVLAHANKFSQAYRYDLSKNKKNCPWSTNFDAMAKKTVLKKLLSHFGILSIEMQTAYNSDQATFDTEGNRKFPDNPQNEADENENKNVIDADVIPESTPEPKKETPKAEKEAPSDPFPVDDDSGMPWE